MIYCAKTVVLSALGGAVLLFSSASVSDEDLQKVLDRRGFHAALNEAYPDYSVYDWPESMRGYRKSPTNFAGDVLFGDFNFDGAIDFSAKLTRPLTDDELAALPERHQETINMVGVVVVCDGLEVDGLSKGFRCSELSKEELGGNYGWLDLTDLTVWVDDLESEREEYGNSDCPAKLKSPSGQKVLSLVEPIGHCDAFFYPIDGGGYGRCVYCAD